MGLFLFNVQATLFDFEDNFPCFCHPFPLDDVICIIGHYYERNEGIWGRVQYWCSVWGKGMMGVMVKRSPSEGYKMQIQLGFDFGRETEIKRDHNWVPEWGLSKQQFDN